MSKVIMSEDFEYRPFRELFLSQFLGWQDLKDLDVEASPTEDLQSQTATQNVQPSESDLFLDSVAAIKQDKSRASNKPLEPAERLVAVCGDKIANEKVLTPTEQAILESKHQEHDLFLAEVKRLEHAKQSGSHKPLTTLGEQVDLQKLTAHVQNQTKSQAVQASWQDKTQTVPVQSPQPVSQEDLAEQKMFLDAVAKLDKKTVHVQKNDILAEQLEQKLAQQKFRHVQLKARLNLANAEDHDSKLFLRAVNKIETQRAKPKKQDGFGTLGEQCPTLLTTKPKENVKKKIKIKKAEPPSIEVQEQEGNDFLKAVEGTVPLKHKKIIPPENPKHEIKVPTQESLADLLEGKFTFEFFCRDEYFEGYIAGLDQLTIDKLRQGMYSPEAHLDLHGFVVEDAYQAVHDFIQSCWYKGLRTVLLVPGRGHNSILGIGVLRSRLQCWLTQEPLKRVVMAFCTAQPNDGGPGSVYVLLRKYRKKGRIQWKRLMDDYINI